MRRVRHALASSPRCQWALAALVAVALCLVLLSSTRLSQRTSGVGIEYGDAWPAGAGDAVAPDPTTGGHALDTPVPCDVSAFEAHVLAEPHAGACSPLVRRALVATQDFLPFTAVRFAQTYRLPAAMGAPEHNRCYRAVGVMRWHNRSFVPVTDPHEATTPAPAGVDERLHVTSEAGADLLCSGKCWIGFARPFAPADAPLSLSGAEHTALRDTISALDRYAQTSHFRAFDASDEHVLAHPYAHTPPFGLPDATAQQAQARTATGYRSEPHWRFRFVRDATRVAARIEGIDWSDAQIERVLRSGAAPPARTTAFAWREFGPDAMDDDGFPDPSDGPVDETALVRAHGRAAWLALAVLDPLPVTHWTLGHLLRLHSAVCVANVSAKRRGRFRRAGEVPLQHFRHRVLAPLSAEVHGVMRAFIRWLRRAFDPRCAGSATHPQRHALVRAVDALVAYDYAHPHWDCNGRVSRLLFNLLLLKHSYPPLLTSWMQPASESARYIALSRDAFLGDRMGFYELILSAIRQHHGI